jgi:Predicted glycosyltransferases
MCDGESKLVSVIIVTYYNTKGIFDTLDSILKQTYPQIEIIISDDGTPGFDESVSLISDYINERNIGNVRNVIINTIKTNVGTVKNVNSVIPMASGKYIKALAAEDCFACVDALEKYVAYMENSDVLIAFAKMRGVTLSGKYFDELQACESDYELLKKYSIKELQNRLFKRNFLPAPAWIAKRELFEEYGLFPEDTRLIEDYPYWIYLTMHNVQFGFIDNILVNYRLSGMSSGGSYSEMFMQDMFIIYDKYIFPYDHRFGILQPVYNQLKRMGLNFYMIKAKWGKMNILQKIPCILIYFPCFIYVNLQKILFKVKNQKTG